MSEALAVNIFLRNISKYSKKYMVNVASSVIDRPVDVVRGVSKTSLQRMKLDLESNGYLKIRDEIALKRFLVKSRRFWFNVENIVLQ